MSEQNKDSLENFFRERAQHPNLEFNESDWQKLETRLDREMPVTFSFLTLIRKIWFIPLLILLVPISWYSFNRLHSSENQERQATATGILDENRNTENIEENKTNEISPSTNEEKDNETYNQKSLTDNDSDNYVRKSNPDLSTNELEIDHYSKSNSEETHTTPGVKNIGYAVSENGAESYGHSEDSKLHFLSSIPPVAYISDTQSPDIAKVNETKNIKPTSPKSISYYAGIGYSPDFSTVGLGNFIAPGSRWTAVIEMSLKNRFYINTGLVWVNNKYEAYNNEYKAPYNYWQNGTVADYTYGECVMLDVPVNLRYNIWSKNRHQLFISGGASTYFLLKEDYWFEYDQDDPNYPHYWGTDKMSVYPFGIINLSFGYQYLLGRKGSLQIEPFIKIPTSGVGWGKVDLHTIGAYFIYKYRFGR